MEDRRRQNGVRCKYLSNHNKPDGTKMVQNFGGDSLELLTTTKCKLADRFRQLKAVDDNKSYCVRFELETLIFTFHFLVTGYIKKLCNFMGNSSD